MNNYEFLIKGEWFKVDKVIKSTFKGRKTLNFVKTVGDTTYSGINVTDLKTRCDNHRDMNYSGITGEQMGYGQGKNMGD